MIELMHISKAFEGKTVLEDVTFSFSENAVIAVTGPSGQGKTTLLNVILGLIKPDAGEVIAPKGLRYACVFQEDRLIEHMSAYQNVRLTAHRSVTPVDVADALASLGLDPRGEEHVSTYSGGMRRRVAIARAVLARPDVLALDEPFKGLDLVARNQAARVILQMCPKAVKILVTHEPDEVAIMHAGGTLELGT
jgi:NitT/TauT family transport system ATP-binding protein